MGPARFSHFLTTIQTCKIQCFTVITTIINVFHYDLAKTTKFTFPCHFSSMALQNFIILIIFTVSFRTFLGLTYISSSLFVNGHAKFRYFHYFHNFCITLVKFCDFCKFPNRIQSWTYCWLELAIHVFRWLICNTVCLKSGSEVNRTKHTTMKIN